MTDDQKHETDDEIFAMIAETASTFNRAVRLAREAGLRVEIEITADIRAGGMTTPAVATHCERIASQSTYRP